MAKKYIAVAGNMGSGKSSLVDFLCKHFGLKPFYEPNNFNPFLDNFYSDMKRWAFHSQIFYLTKKYRIHRELDGCDDTVIQDRTIYEDAEVFAEHLYRQGYMDDKEYNIYKELYEGVVDVVNPPDLVVYLNCPLPTLKKRISLRGRKIEKSIPNEYLISLEKLYKRWIKRYKRSPVIEYSTAKLDYMSDFIHRGDLIDTIAKYL